MNYVVSLHGTKRYNYELIMSCQQGKKEVASIFQRSPYVGIFAFTAAFAWGWAYPLIKLGFVEFGITTEMTASKMLFAGLRFACSGLIILLIAHHQHRRFAIRAKADWWFILLFALLNTTLHYAFFYFGLSHSAGSRASILNSLSVFSVVILACLFFKSDKMNLNKIIGCIIGFCGLVMLNIDIPNVFSSTPTTANNIPAVSFLGDTMIIMNALCGAFASLLTRGMAKRVDIFVGTGYSLGLGGVLLIIPALAMNASLPCITPIGLLYLMLLIGISTIGFTLYNRLLVSNPIGKVAIYNSMIPVVGALSSCLCLGEPFSVKYIVAGSLASFGIFIVNKGK